MHSKIYLTWNELRNLISEVNRILGPLFQDNPPIQMNNRQTIYANLKWCFDELEKTGLPWQKDYRIPELAVNLWKGLSAKTKVAGYVKHFRNLTPILCKLNHNAQKMYLVYRDSAWNDEKADNPLGLKYGETCIGGKKMAEMANIHVSCVSKGNKELEEAGLVKKVRRLWFNGPFVRLVNMGDYFAEKSLDDGIVRRAYK